MDPIFGPWTSLILSLLTAAGICGATWLGIRIGRSTLTSALRPRGPRSGRPRRRSAAERRRGRREPGPRSGRARPAGDRGSRVWGPRVRRVFPAAAGLGPAALGRLCSITRRFLERIPIEGAGGVELARDDRLSIAAQACYLLVGMGEPEVFPRTEAIVVYPGRFTPKRPDFQYRWNQVQPVEGPRIGEAWGTGVVVLALDGIRHGAEPDATGNLVLHEFAHRLDQLDGEASGHPVGMPPDLGWEAILSRRTEELRRAAEAGRDTPMDPYGAKNRAEFFAVGTEAFFMTPQRLREGMPDVFEALARYYGRDPVAERIRAGLKRNRAEAATRGPRGVGLEPARRRPARREPSGGPRRGSRLGRARPADP